MSEILPIFVGRKQCYAMVIDMTLEPAVGQMPLGSSYFWDAPQLPSPELYPYIRNEDGDEIPLQFICQVNCAELPASELPRRGMLYFFGTIDYYLGYDVPLFHGMGHWPDGLKVVYADAAPEQLQRCNPFTEDDMIKPHPIVFHEGGSPTNDGLRLLGTPFEEEARMAFDSRWVQLLQLDSVEDDDFSLMFADMGLLYVMIERSRLRQHDFSHVEGYMTSM